MIDLGPHAVFIIWAYGGVGVTLVALIGLVMGRACRANRHLTALEAQGLKRGADKPMDKSS